MASSEEYLASLGVDFTSSEAALKTISTIVSHVGNEFDDLEGIAGKLERQIDKFGNSTSNAAPKVNALTKSLNAYEDVSKRLTRNMAQQSLGFNLTPLSQSEISSYGNLQTGLTRAGDKQKGRDDSAAASAAAAAAQEKAAAAAAKLAAAEEKAAVATQKLTGTQNANSTAAKGAAASQDQLTGSLANQRYALYDIATTYGVISTALLGFSALSIKAGADFESAFTNVQRTADGGTIGSLNDIKEELIDLSTQIPKTFDELTGIATLGNQLGVASDSLIDFTKVTSQFSTVTGVSVEAAATAFGTLGNLLQLQSSEYENLGSSIALAGRRSVATEAQIVAVAQQIASYTQLAGYSADETIGLATALSSLAIPPEQARSAIQSLFTVLDKATAHGGDELQNFANLLGLTADEATNLYKNSPEQFVSQLAEALGRLDKQSLTLTLEALGLDEKRTSTVLTKLASNTDILTTSMANAQQGYSENSELSRQYALSLDDLNTQLVLLFNALTAFAAAGSTELVPGLSGAVVALIALVNGARDFISTDVGGTIAQIVIALSIAVGLFFGYTAATALATASTYALVTAQASLGAGGARTGIIGLISTILGVRTASDAATVGVSKLRLGFLALGRATIVLAIITAIIEVIFNFNESLRTGAEVFRSYVNGMEAGARAAYSFLQSIKSNIPVLGGFIDLISRGTGAQVGLFDFAGKSVNNFIKTLPKAKEETTSLGESIGGVNPYLDALEEDATSSFGSVGDGAEDAAAEVRTLVDYASDLSSVFNRAFEIRFGGIQGMDKIDGTWNAARKTIVDANTAIAASIAKTNQALIDYQAETAQLTSDRSIATYWLSVAEAYGDALRAGQLRADIADIDAKLSKSAADLAATQTDGAAEVASAQDKTNKTLEGNSEAAIANRAEILGLVSDYQGYIASLASSGLSTDDLKVRTAQLKADFIAQATQLGYNVNQLGSYADAFDDVTVAINNVPRNITVTANTNPALQAFNELEARARALGGMTIPGPNIEPTINPARLTPVGGLLDPSDVGITRRALEQSNPQSLVLIGRQLYKQGYKEGGWTGGGGKNDIAGYVHGQEYVLNATGAQMFPRSVLDAANQGRSVAPMASAARASGVSSAAEIVARLSLEDKALLQQISDRVGINFPGAALTEVVGSNNANNTRRGGS